MSLEAFLGDDEHAEHATPKMPDAYDKLPDSIKSVYSRKEWLWLSDKEKSNLVTMETEPEC